MAAAHKSIGEVLAMLVEEFPEVTISKIRFLESQGLISPERTAAGYRKFTDAEIDRLRFVLREQRENYLPLRVIRDRLENDDSESVLRPDDMTDPSMPRGLRMPSRAHPAGRAADIDSTGSFARPAPMSGAAATATTNPVARRLTRQDVQEQLAIDEELLCAIEASGLVRPMVMGDLVLYHPRDLDVLGAAADLVRMGIEARHLKGWRIAAERELDVVEQLVAPAPRRGERDDESAQLVAKFLAVGGRIRDGVLRNRLHSRDD
jgi:DNA-binding transcriptional MerR regulator